MFNQPQTSNLQSPWQTPQGNPTKIRFCNMFEQISSILENAFSSIARVYKKNNIKFAIQHHLETVMRILTPYELKGVLDNRQVCFLLGSRKDLFEVFDHCTQSKGFQSKNIQKHNSKDKYFLEKYSQDKYSQEKELIPKNIEDNYISINSQDKQLSLGKDQNRRNECSKSFQAEQSKVYSNKPSRKCETIMDQNSMKRKQEKLNDQNLHSSVLNSENNNRPFGSIFGFQQSGLQPQAHQPKINRQLVKSRGLEQYLCEWIRKSQLEGVYLIRNDVLRQARQKGKSCNLRASTGWYSKFINRNLDIKKILQMNYKNKKFLSSEFMNTVKCNEDSDNGSNFRIDSQEYNQNQCFHVGKTPFQNGMREESLNYENSKNFPQFEVDESSLHQDQDQNLDEQFLSESSSEKLLKQVQDNDQVSQMYGDHKKYQLYDEKQ